MRRLRLVIVVLLIAGLLAPSGIAEAKTKKSRRSVKAPKATSPGPLIQGFDTSRPVIALTFDDGAANTVAIMSILRAQEASATFFVCGARIGDGSEIATAAANGFEIGNHTWDHVSLYRQTYAWDFWQVQATNDAIQAATGVRPRWVRSRSGQIDGTGMRVIRDLGQAYINWDVHSDDTNWKLSPGQISTRVVGGAHPGAVVLMHATRPETIVALPGIIAELKARGYRLVTLSTMETMGTPHYAPKKTPKKSTKKAKPKKRATRRRK